MVKEHVLNGHMVKVSPALEKEVIEQEKEKTKDVLDSAGLSTNDTSGTEETKSYDKKNFSGVFDEGLYNKQTTNGIEGRKQPYGNSKNNMYNYNGYAYANNGYSNEQSYPYDKNLDLMYNGQADHHKHYREDTMYNPEMTNNYMQPNNVNAYPYDRYTHQQFNTYENFNMSQMPPLHYSKETRNHQASTTFCDCYECRLSIKNNFQAQRCSSNMYDYHDMDYRSKMHYHPEMKKGLPLGHLHQSHYESIAHQSKGYDYPDEYEGKTYYSPMEYNTYGYEDFGKIPEYYYDNFAYNYDEARYPGYY